MPRADRFREVCPEYAESETWSPDDAGLDDSEYGMDSYDLRRPLPPRSRSLAMAVARGDVGVGCCSGCARGGDLASVAAAAESSAAVGSLSVELS